MRNGMVNLSLPGYERYKITIDRGCFYCYGSASGGEAVAPAFYLSMD
jgi:hypothetical protein